MPKYLRFLPRARPGRHGRRLSASRNRKIQWATPNPKVKIKRVSRTLTQRQKSWFISVAGTRICSSILKKIKRKDKNRFADQKLEFFRISRIFSKLLPKSHFSKLAISANWSGGVTILTNRSNSNGKNSTCFLFIYFIN